MSEPLILLVDESPGARKVMRLTLQAEGYVVAEAHDGASALREVALAPPALCIIDCRLPDMEGFELGKRLRELAPALPLIAIAGWVQADDRRVLLSGFLEVLAKPLEPSRLAEVVRRHLGPPALHSPHVGRTVLLVDDDPTQRKLAQLALASAGFAVAAAESGESALLIAAQHKPDVIVSDVLMPRMDGFALCKRVRSQDALADVPVVLMSAHYLEREDCDLASRFGATGYVSRTGGFDAVVKKVIEAVDSPVPELSALPEEDLQSEYLRRVAHQLERQANIGVGLARRVSLQASALAVIDGLSDSLAREVDPESALGDTLVTCLEAAGLAMGAILLYLPNGQLVLKAQSGTPHGLQWSPHADLVHSALARGGVVMPSAEGGEGGDRLLLALGAGSALIVPIIARAEVLGVLLLASKVAELAGAEGESATRAARSVSMQLGQALALSRTFSKLASAQQRYRALFENARDAIAVLTPDGVILEANRAWEQMLRVPHTQVIGRHIGAFAIDEAGEGLRSEYDKALHQAALVVEPVSYRRADDTIASVEVSRTVVALGGEPFVLSIGRDVSERLRLEEQLRQSQKMEAVGRLAGGVAHDFNNLLSVILSYAEMLIGDPKVSDGAREDIQEIHKAGTRAADLTRQLLMFSRQQVVAPRVIDLSDLLTDISKMLNRILGADVDMNVVHGEKVGRVRVDPGSMEQVVMNLVVNARDAMPRGGRLTIETANVLLDEAYTREHHGVTAGPHVMLAVSDTGTGMDKATQARIFEPFYTTKGPGKGTGLGLSTVFGIVQQSGGSIWVYSEPGRGTTFKVYLPRVDAALESTRVTAPLAIARGEETILLVEDDEQVRVVARGILRKHGYHVLEARDAEDAVRCADEHRGPIALLLTDVVMPRVSGPELASRLTPGRPDMRVLCMSGYTDDSVVRHGALGASVAYVQKPLTPQVLTRKVREVLDAALVRPAAQVERTM